ncbi:MULTISPECIES: tRNA (guanosine(37)-N1)-methyltransferase TrmD [unclassified Paenibacillus]|uniref:tRNA (guanosine(37)-N1)-methyltransferase TrmD n=1 Tax=unclassified Paenibacillus TaxID=185978 RepID=UPI000954B385|nr:MULTISPECIES: tRNA (guanosine(37)-N1)-methyltransferase TrmD [unclassified Paenibacillus]ASS65739.1 tRNA (guanosine(37)-N1)-methyltransferase TrmD [Paenibacillus sp. RUD330]SIQ25713.1 tRNA (guanine37-N1)-methyltransferase [Paenibacillus sp. RU4X]SIQ47527.1 tRNA (guanine37-N1)-methyltransferase [Paenibacillus sp. RU4T]
MRIDVLTLFPEMFDGVFGASILGKARDKGIVSLQAVNFRNYANNKHNTVDDYPYGGGGGMVLKAEPVFSAVEDLLAGSSGDAGESQAAENKPRVILMCPQGEPFSQRKAEELSREDRLIFICGHYEGYDERIREHLVTDELSIGDYVLTGGELPAMVMIDSVVRLLPGVLGNESSAVTDSYSTGLLEYPHYTRPASFRGWDVPEVLISGHHRNIDAWRRQQSLHRTLQRRPDLLETAELTDKERKWLREQQSRAAGPESFS